MELIKDLSLQLLNASTVGNIPLCIELSEKISKIMNTYKTSC